MQLEGNRKQYPVGTGVLDYFSDALVAIARVSLEGNIQHQIKGPLRWDRAKSTDEADALIRHFLERGTLDTDGLRHSAKMAWRALALLQKEIEGECIGQFIDTGAPPVIDWPPSYTIQKPKSDARTAEIERIHQMAMKSLEQMF